MRLIFDTAERIVVHMYAHWRVYGPLGGVLVMAAILLAIPVATVSSWYLAPALVLVLAGALMVGSGLWR